MREFSSAGSEHLPYKQRVGGSNPSTPTNEKQSDGLLFFVYGSILPSILTFPPRPLPLSKGGAIILISSPMGCFFRLREYSPIHIDIPSPTPPFVKGWGYNFNKQSDGLLISFVEVVSYPH